VRGGCVLRADRKAQVETTAGERVDRDRALREPRRMVMRAYPGSSAALQ
jgi:hypothetical protein